MQFAMGKAQLGKIHRFPSSFRFKEININVNLDDSDLLGGKISLAVRDSDFNAKHGRLSVTMQRSHFGGSSYSFIFFFLDSRCWLWINIYARRDEKEGQADEESDCDGS